MFYGGGRGFVGESCGRGECEAGCGECVGEDVGGEVSGGGEGVFYEWCFFFCFCFCFYFCFDDDNDDNVGEFACRTRKDICANGRDEKESRSEFTNTLSPFAAARRQVGSSECHRHHVRADVDDSSFEKLHRFRSHLQSRLSQSRSSNSPHAGPYPLGNLRSMSKYPGSRIFARNGQTPYHKHPSQSVIVYKKRYDNRYRKSPPAAPPPFGNFFFTFIFLANNGFAADGTRARYFVARRRECEDAAFESKSCTRCYPRVCGSWVSGQIYG